MKYCKLYISLNKYIVVVVVVVAIERGCASRVDGVVPLLVDRVSLSTFRHQFILDRRFLRCPWGAH